MKQFPIEGGRYIVFLFEATSFEGEISSSEEGSIHWICAEELDQVNLVQDFRDLVDVILNNKFSEFQYVIEADQWKVVKK